MKLPQNGMFRSQQQDFHQFVTYITCSYLADALITEPQEDAGPVS